MNFYPTVLLLRLWKIHVQGLYPGSVSVFHTPFSSLHPDLDQENQ